MPGLAPGARQSLERLARDHGLPAVTVTGGSTAGFRLRARLAIRGRSNSPKLGLFEQGTHRVVTIPHCSVQHPLINRVAGVVRRALVDAKVPIYSDKAHVGLARYLHVVVERSSQTAQVVLVANSNAPDPGTVDSSAADSLSACLALIRERLGTELHSLWFNANLGRSNVILGPDCVKYCGPDSVVEHFGGAAVHYPPGAFGQNNLDVAQMIVAHVREQIPAGARVAEFYAGVGAIGLSVLARTREIRMNEMSLPSLQGLSLGLAQLDAGEREKISVFPGAAGEALEAARGAEVVIADPPRKGLDPALTLLLSEHAPERFIYVSCGLDSFVRDVAQLTSRGRLRLCALNAFDLLPFTEHAECVGVFERR